MTAVAVRHEGTKLPYDKENSGDEKHRHAGVLHSARRWCTDAVQTSRQNLSITFRAGASGRAALDLSSMLKLSP